MADSISKTRGQISELTHLVPLRRGLVPIAEWGASGAPPVSFADRLNVILRAFDDRERAGFPSVIRLFRQIHSAKWLLLDGGTRLLLTVVFDGDWNDYMQSLARDVPSLLNLIFSNTVGWRHDFLDHPLDQRSEALMQFIRAHQLEVNFLYVHRTDLTVRDLDKLLPPPGTPAHAGLAREFGSLDERRRILLEECDAAAPHTVALAQKRFRAVLEPRYAQPAFASAYREAFGEDPLAGEQATTQGGSR